MSQQEFEKMDREVMDVANRAGEQTTPQPAAPAAPLTRGAEGGRISPRAALGRNDSEGRIGSGGVKVTPFLYSRAELVRRTLWSLIQVLACVFVATLFVVALLDPEFVLFVSCAGVLICGMVAAVLADRAIREWKAKEKDHGGR